MFVGRQRRKPAENPEKALRLEIVCGVAGWARGAGGASALTLALASASSVPFEFPGRTAFQGSLPLLITHIVEECSFQEVQVSPSFCWFKLEENGLWKAIGGKHGQARLLLVRYTQVLSPGLGTICYYLKRQAHLLYAQWKLVPDLTRGFSV